MTTSSGASTAPSTGPSITTNAGGSRPARRGLLDALLMTALLYAVYAQTPLGAIVETGVQIARGQHDHPSWLATFRGRETEVHVDDATMKRAMGEPVGADGSLDKAAATRTVSADALASFVAVHGSCDAGACTIDAPPRLSAFVPGAHGRVDVDVVARGLQAAATSLPAAYAHDVELAIEALYVGAIPVALAVEQAERSGLADPGDVEVHAPFLAPSLRRGPLQGALAVLVAHRLRTLAWPTDARFAITSPFGARIHPVTGQASFHNGTDIGVPVDTPLSAASDGAVLRMGRDSISGNYVVLDHGLGIQTTYCHMNAVDVVRAARVRQRAQVGLSGATGRVTGPHLHYILRVQNEPVDAQLYGGAPRSDARPPSASMAP